MSASQDFVDRVDMPPQDLFELLYSRRRRLAILELARLGSVTELSELSRVIADRHDVGSGTTSPQKRVHISLLQQHLPTLEDAGLISVDRTNTVTPTPEIQAIADIIDAVGVVCVPESKGGKP